MKFQRPFHFLIFFPNYFFLNVFFFKKLFFDSDTTTSDSYCLTNRAKRIAEKITVWQKTTTKRCFVMMTSSILMLVYRQFDSDDDREGNRSRRRLGSRSEDSAANALVRFVIIRHHSVLILSLLFLGTISIAEWMATQQETSRRTSYRWWRHYESSSWRHSDPSFCISDGIIPFATIRFRISSIAS